MYTTLITWLLTLLPITSAFAITPPMASTIDIDQSGGCAVGGCSNVLCLESAMMADIIGTCEYMDHYVCYQNSRCERQANNQCGWTIDSTLAACLDSYNVLASCQTPKIHNSMGTDCVCATTCPAGSYQAPDCGCLISPPIVTQTPSYYPTPSPNIPSPTVGHTSSRYGDTDFDQDLDWLDYHNLLMLSGNQPQTLYTMASLMRQLITNTTLPISSPILPIQTLPIEIVNPTSTVLPGQDIRTPYVTPVSQ